MFGVVIGPLGEAKQRLVCLEKFVSPQAHLKPGFELTQREKSILKGGPMRTTHGLHLEDLQRIPRMASMPTRHGRVPTRFALPDDTPRRCLPLTLQSSS